MSGHKLLLIYCYLVRLILLILPDTPQVMRLRGWLYLIFSPSSGQNFQVASTAVLRGIENIYVGNDVYLGPNSYLLARSRIILEDEVLIAMNVVIVDSNHGKSGAAGSYRFGRGKSGTVILGKGCWVAANCVITAGQTIPPGEVVPACTRV